MEYLPLFIVSMLAFVVPILANKIRFIRVPGVVLEILVGIIIGQSVLNYVDPRHDILEFMAHFGFAFLMFLSGYEIDFSAINLGSVLRGRFRVKRLLKNNLIAGVLIFLGTLSLSYAISVMLYEHEYIANVELMTLILSTTSVGVVVPTLKERGLLGESFGQAVVVAALVSDLATMILLTALTLFLAGGTSAPLSEHVEVLLVFVLFGAFYLAYRIGQWLSRIRVFLFVMSELAHAASQLRVRGALAIMLLFLVLSESLGAEVILGAFLAGAILSVFSSKTESFLSMKLDAIGYGFFIPIFFIWVGIGFRMDALTGSSAMFILIPLLVLAAFLNKLLPACLLAPLYGLRKAIAGGTLLSSRLSLIVAASAIGRQMDLITDEVNSTVIIIAILTSTVSPVLFNRLHRKVDLGDEKIIIIGAGKIGRALAKRLRLLDRTVVLVDNDRKSVTKGQSEGLHCIHSDGSRPAGLRRAGLDANDMLVAVTGDDEANFRACDIARRVFGVEKCIARDNNPANTERFLAHGIRPMNLVQSAAITLENLVLRPAAYDLLADPQGRSALLEVRLTNRGLDGRKFGSLPMIHHDMVILFIRRGPDLMFPDPEFRLQLGDVLLVFGTAAALRRAELYFAPADGLAEDLDLETSPAS
jgi:Kef-type K+ transport system membrane component KefB/Trk K+ transport system NAD-binding subunit